MPEAANMLQLSYSEECEQFAQKWVERCEFKHSRGPYGENLWDGGAGVSDGKKAFWPYLMVTVIDVN